MKKVNVSGTILKVALGSTLLLVLGAVAFLSREVQPDTHLVTKVLDNSKFEEQSE